MVLFEVLSLDIPYRRSVKKAFDIPKQIERGIRPTLPDLPPFYRDVVDLFVQCTEMDADERPTAHAITKRLRKMMDKRSEQAKRAQGSKRKGSAP